MTKQPSEKLKRIIETVLVHPAMWQLLVLTSKLTVGQEVECSSCLRPVTKENIGTMAITDMRSIVFCSACEKSSMVWANMNNYMNNANANAKYN